MFSTCPNLYERPHSTLNETKTVFQQSCVELYVYILMVTGYHAQNKFVYNG